MTTPAQPATGSDPAPATGDPSSQSDPTGSAPTGNPAPPPPATGDDWATTFEGQSPADVKKALDHSRTWEKRAKDNKKAFDDLKAKGPQDGEPTVDDYKTRAEAAEDRAAELAYQTTVSRVAGQVGADAEALLDSDSFRNAVAEELGDDFDDDDLKAAVDKVAKQYASKPRFSSQPAGPARSGAEINGGPGGLRQVTEDELARMSPEQIVDAQNKGQLNALLGIT